MRIFISILLVIGSLVVFPMLFVQYNNYSKMQECIKVYTEFFPVFTEEQIKMLCELKIKG